MNLPDAPIAHEGFFATHFLAVSDQDKSKDFYVRILGRKLIKPENPLLHQAGKYVDHSQFRRWPDSRQARGPS
jgi:catechol 2,3-dioxygenase-like lactoylglutathione lyase family enzyme